MSDVLDYIDRLIQVIDTILAEGQPSNELAIEITVLLQQIHECQKKILQIVNGN